jgi:hypothetical protein
MGSSCENNLTWRATLISPVSSCRLCSRASQHELVSNFTAVASAGNRQRPCHVAGLQHSPSPIKAS